MKKKGENRLWDNGASCFVGFEELFWSVESGWHTALCWAGKALVCIASFTCLGYRHLRGERRTGSSLSLHPRGDWRRSYVYDCPVPPHSPGHPVPSVAIIWSLAPEFRQNSATVLRSTVVIHTLCCTSGLILRHAGCSMSTAEKTASAVTPLVPSKHTVVFFFVFSSSSCALYLYVVIQQLFCQRDCACVLWD